MTKKNNGSPPLIGVVIPSYNNRADVAACLVSVLQSTYENLRIVVVDNASTDDTAAYVRSRWPDITVLEQEHNTGYVGAANRGWQELSRVHLDYLFILTQDVVLAPDWAEPLVAAMESDGLIAAAQPVLYYQDETRRINSIGNVIHFLGFGYASGDGLKESDHEAVKRLGQTTEIVYASGGALCLRASCLKKIGLFQDSFFMYHDDLDLGWRLRLTGYKSVLVPSSRAYHRYEWHRSALIKYEYGERNRQMCLLENYRLPTLLLIFPAWFVMETAIVAFSFRNGWWRQKIRGYWYIIKHLPEILNERARHQALRTVSDRRVTRDFSGDILYQNDPTSLLFLANPFFRWYWKIVRLLIIW